jgi:integrase
MPWGLGHPFLCVQLLWLSDDLRHTFGSLDGRSGAKTSCTRKVAIEDFHFHDSRHCFGSWMAQRQVPFENRQKLMRHKDPKMTMRYSHLDAESERVAINKLPTFNILESKSQQNSQQEEQPKVVAFGK